MGCKVLRDSWLWHAHTSALLQKPGPKSSLLARSQEGIIPLTEKRCLQGKAYMTFGVLPPPPLFLTVEKVCPPSLPGQGQQSVAAAFAGGRDMGLADVGDVHPFLLPLL